MEDMIAAEMKVQYSPMAALNKLISLDTAAQAVSDNTIATDTTHYCNPLDRVCSRQKTSSLPVHKTKGKNTNLESTHSNSVAKDIGSTIKYKESFEAHTVDNVKNNNQGSVKLCSEVFAHCKQSFLLDQADDSDTESNVSLSPVLEIKKRPIKLAHNSTQMPVDSLMLHRKSYSNRRESLSAPPSSFQRKLEDDKLTVSDKPVRRVLNSVTTNPNSLDSNAKISSNLMESRDKQNLKRETNMSMKNSFSKEFVKEKETEYLVAKRKLEQTKSDEENARQGVKKEHARALFKIITSPFFKRQPKGC